MMDGMKIQKKSVFRQDLSSSSLTAWSMPKLTYPLWRILSTDREGRLFLQPSCIRPAELCRFRIKTSKKFFPRHLEDLDVRSVHVRALSV
jgi:hypothetical protein